MRRFKESYSSLPNKERTAWNAACKIFALPGLPGSSDLARSRFFVPVEFRKGLGIKLCSSAQHGQLKFRFLKSFFGKFMHNLRTT